MLPGLSGSELIAKIRESSRIPVIVLSARMELSDKVELLAGRPKRVFTKQQIYEAVWQEAYAMEDKTITVHISNIRAKLRQSGTDGYIRTVWGIGFKLDE